MANRGDRLAAGDGVEVQQPLLAEQADVQIDAIERAEHADRIRAVLQHMRRPDGVGPLEELGQRAARDIVVELLVVQLAARQGLPPPALRLRMRSSRL